jgi:hypothetical protein
MSFLQHIRPAVPINEIVDKLVQIVKVDSFCSKISTEYIQNLFMNLFHATNFEILFLMLEDEKKKINEPPTFFSFSALAKSLVGFLVVERKEDPKNNRFLYCLNLMCIKKKKLPTVLQPPLKKSGQLLLGMFLYGVIESQTNPPIAILELAHSYLNFAGLCLYEKFGFTYNERIQHFFPPLDSVIPLLPMSLDFQRHSLYKNKTNEEKQKRIIQIVANKLPAKQIPLYKSTICSNKFNKQPTHQKYLAKLKILFRSMKFHNVHVLLDKSNLDCWTFKNLLKELFPSRTFACSFRPKPVLFNESEIQTVQTLIFNLENQQKLFINT